MYQVMYDMCCGTVWRGLVWYGVAHGVVWCDVVWYGHAVQGCAVPCRVVVWCGVVWCSVV